MAKIMRKIKGGKYSLGEYFNVLPSTSPPFSKIERWRPNNYRRGCDISIYKDARGKVLNYGRGLGIIEILHRKSKNFFSKHKFIVNNSGQVYLKNFKKVTIMLTKSRILAILPKNPVNNGHNLTGTTQKRILYIMNKVNNISDKLDYAIMEFCRIYDIYMRNSPEWVNHEDELRGDDFIETLPSDLTFYSSKGVKKVYPKGIEFVSVEGKRTPGKSVINYLQNRDIDFSSIIKDIYKRLDYIEKKLEDHLNPRVRLK